MVKSDQKCGQNFSEETP